MKPSAPEGDGGFGHQTPCAASLSPYGGRSSKLTGSSERCPLFCPVFGWEGSPTKIDDRKKVGYPYSNLSNLVDLATYEDPGEFFAEVEFSELLSGLFSLTSPVLGREP